MNFNSLLILIPLLADRDWDKDETDYLFDLCRKYDIRWTITHDRYNWKDKTRTMEVKKFTIYI